MGPLPGWAVTRWGMTSSTGDPGTGDPDTSDPDTSDPDTGPTRSVAPRSLPPENDAQGADDRGVTADDRDRGADRRDSAAQDRDRSSGERDRRAQARDDRSARIDVEAAADRIDARHDREAAAGDRALAGHDRTAASSDRALSHRERAQLLMDELTGTYRRAAGFLELEREMIRAERTGQRFVLGFLDVDGLKAVNDTLGHPRGDQVLQTVVALVSGQLREYDVVVRFGGDEFVVGLPEVGLEEAGRRFAAVEAAVRDAGASISVGLAERTPDEGLEALIARADQEMYRGRAARREAGQGAGPPG